MQLINMAKKKKIDWLNHFLEFIVVVIGILLAFQLNTCSQEKKELALVDEHIESLIVETKFNVDLIKSSISNSEAILGIVDTLLVAVSDPERLEREHFLTFKAMGLQVGYLKKNAYNTLVTTGDIRFIEDFELQNDIISLYEYYKWTDGVNEMSRNTFIEYYLPYMMEYMDLSGGSLQAQDLYDNKKFKNILSTYTFSLTALLERQKATLEEMQAFIDKHGTDNE